MTLENCKRLLAHYEKEGMVKEAAEMKVKVDRKQSQTPSKKQDKSKS
jgi:hypothetical protein|tara:strand:- start:1045 stop:1185 length:141 start_codon:yes stop_codon:yes gene_type:complete